MNRLFLSIVALGTLQAQIIVDTVAGGKVRSGVPIQDVPFPQVSGLTWDLNGNLVFGDSHDLIRRIRPDGIVETIAGTGVTGYSGDGGSATSASLHGPAAPQYDAAGNLYFFDGGNSRIRRIDTRGVITTLAGDGIPYSPGMDLEGPALLRSIGVSGLAVDPAGMVYFSDSRSLVIRRITKTAQLEIVAGVYDPTCGNCSDGDGGSAKAAHVNRPGLLTLDRSGNLYVVEATGNDDIRRISKDGIITKFAGYGALFDNPPQPGDGGPALSVFLGMISGLAADGSGNIYVAHVTLGGPLHVTALVRRIDSNGIINTVVKGQSGILAADVFGKLVLGNFNGLFLVASDGTLSTITSTVASVPKSAPDGTPAREAWLLLPGPIAFNRAGELYFGERQTCVIRKITNGVLTTFASGKCADSMAFDSRDRLWVAGNGEFNIIAPDGSITPYKLPFTPGNGSIITLDGKDRLYVLNLFTLTRVGPDGSVTPIVTLPRLPVGPGDLSRLGLDPAKNVYFWSGRDSSVYRVNDDGSYRVVYKNAFGVAIDAAGTAWAGNVFTNPSGTFSLGRPDTGYSGDGGPAQSARFYGSSGATVAPNGDLYFVDGERIRRFTGIQPQTPPVVSPGGIVSSASYNLGGISPGELVSIFGSNFGASELVMPTFENNSVPTQLRRTRVLFDDQLGEIVAMTPNLINVLAPYSLTPGAAVQVRVQVDTNVSSPIIMPVVASVPDLYTADASGSGQGIFINQDGSINSSTHPASMGSVVALYGTGEGFLSPQLPKGALVISTPYPTMPATPTVTIAGQPAEVRYAGAAPYFPLGVFEIDVRIPPGVPAGNARVAVTIGDRSTTRIVTVAVK